MLGRVYEQYLGHVAQIVRQRQREYQMRRERGLTPEHAIDEVIEVVSRPQRRRAHGIYYTPHWVVDYLVRQTVGRFIGEHRNRPDAIHEMRVLDPACGSGSFLIRAYDELLRWHAGERPPEWVFADERLAVLRNNIFGADLDQQAIEIARLNLLLRALRERQLLPPLGDNIKRGNSLIQGERADLEPFFGEEWRDKHPFDWAAEFPGAAKSGGFDVVIGNPPYVQIQSLDRREADYFRQHYETARGSFDLSVLFVEKALQLLKPGGRLGFITSGKFLKTQYGQRLQRLLVREATTEHVVDLSGLQVFGDATTYPVLLVVRKGASEEPLAYLWAGDNNDAAPHEILQAKEVRVEQQALTQGVWPPAHGASAALMEKMEQGGVPLSSLAAHVFQGLITSADRVYHLTLMGHRDDGLLQVRNGHGEERALEPGLLRPLVAGKNVSRYAVEDTGDLLLFPYRVEGQKATLIPAYDLEWDYPETWRYLQDHEAALRGRERGKMDHDEWYAFGRTQSLGLHDTPKLAHAYLVKRLEVFYDRTGGCYLDNVHVGGIILKEPTDSNFLYVLALLNSCLLDWYFHQISAPYRGGYRAANRQYMDPLPIRWDAEDETARDLQRRIVGLAQEMLELQARLAPIRHVANTERDDLLHYIELRDRAIDQAVYELYRLTEEERGLVEARADPPTKELNNDVSPS